MVQIGVVGAHWWYDQGWWGTVGGMIRGGGGPLVLYKGVVGELGGINRGGGGPLVV